MADIRSEAWLNLFWEYINGKLFAVQPILRMSGIICDPSDSTVAEDALID